MEEFTFDIFVRAREALPLQLRSQLRSHQMIHYKLLILDKHLDCMVAERLSPVLKLIKIAIQSRKYIFHTTHVCLLTISYTDIFDLKFPRRLPSASPIASNHAGLGSIC